MGEGNETKLTGEPLLAFIMNRFNKSRAQALAIMEENGQDVSGLEAEPPAEPKPPTPQQQQAAEERSAEQINQDVADVLAKELDLPINSVTVCNIWLCPPDINGRQNGPGYVLNTRDAKKWTVSCIWPMAGTRGDISTFQPDNTGDFSIGVSKHRGATVLVNEIKRRLAGYEEEYAKQKTRADEYDANNAAQRAKLVELCGIVDGEPSERSQSTSTSCRHGVWEIQVNHNGTEASIRTYQLPADVMADVLKLIASRVPKQNY
jgi:hypothetical protein